jgi:predicted nucleotidyltransferase
MCMRGSMPQLLEMLNSQLVLYQTAVGSAPAPGENFCGVQGLYRRKSADDSFGQTG